MVSSVLVGGTNDPPLPCIQGVVTLLEPLPDPVAEQQEQQDGQRPEDDPEGEGVGNLADGEETVALRPVFHSPFFSARARWS